MIVIRRAIFPLGTFSAAIAVALGAFAAHKLRDTLTPDLLGVFETGVRYQMYHAFGMMLAGILAFLPIPARPGYVIAAGWAFLAGTVLFSGSLYVLALTGIRWIGFLTPFGGVCFIAGWILLGLSVLSRPRRQV